MPGDREPLERLDAYFAAARIAHEVIWDLHEELTLLGKSDEHTREQLRRAARVAAVEMPDVARKALKLRRQLAEQQLLDPSAAQQTLLSLRAELERIEPELKELRALQNEVAREFRRLIDGAES